MALTAIVFDMGETLVDETRQQEEIERSRHASPFTEADLYPDALPCIVALRARGLTVGVAGNMSAANEAFIAPHVDWVGSSERWGVAKPAPAFGLQAVQVRRGPWGHLHQTPSGARRIDSLLELVA